LRSRAMEPCSMVPWSSIPFARQLGLWLKTYLVRLISGSYLDIVEGTNGWNMIAN
jgi:hypothetical protein